MEEGNRIVLCLLILLIRQDDWIKLIDCSQLFWVIKHAGGDRMETIELVLQIAPSEKTQNQFLKALDDPVRQEGLDEDEKRIRQAIKHLPLIKRLMETDKPVSKKKIKRSE